MKNMFNPEEYYHRTGLCPDFLSRHSGLFIKKISTGGLGGFLKVWNTHAKKSSMGGYGQGISPVRNVRGEMVCQLGKSGSEGMSKGK